jgi:GDP-L-fucose synthase
LTDLAATKKLFQEERPEFVFHAAAQVYGIMGNMRNKGLSFFKNILINTHVIEAARLVAVKKIVAMGSGCVYPYPSPGLPLREEMVWMGIPHDSENSYAHAKRAMLAQLNAYRENYGLEFAFVISGNLYGPNDKFDSVYGHVTPALVRKFHEAKQVDGRVSVWGDGSARRDFLYSQDVGEALLRIMDGGSSTINMGSGVVSSIKQIVDILSDYTGMGDRVDWDPSKPNGQDYREYNLSKLKALGFTPRFSIESGIRATYDWYAANAAMSRK